MNADTLTILQSQVAGLADSLTAISGKVATIADSSTAIQNSVAGSTFMSENIWIMMCALLVFVMGLGFACVESGLCRAKNCANIMFKNFAVPAIGITLYAFFGFNVMYPGEAWNIAGIFGFSGFGLPVPEGGFTAAYNGHYTYFTDWLFQAMFAATAATIVSGAVAERVKLNSFLIFTALYVAFVYPVVGSWTWGNGWLAAKGFHDLAGSTLVHSVGGWAALAGVMILGPRIGRYKNGKIYAFPAHSIPLATIGVFVLWIGWWGFNAGSALSGDPTMTSWILVTTNLAAVAGIITATATSWIISKKPDVTMALNGCLAGLVAITAGADCVSPLSAWIIGAIAGILVVLSVFMFDRLRLDDPVGALSVHLVNGVWGTFAVGIFDITGSYTIGTQLLGIVSYAVPCFLGASVIFLLIKKTVGLRVSEKGELRGLDASEHGQESYGGFQIFSNT